jgi:hypothetical protein
MQTARSRVGSGPRCRAHGAEEEYVVAKENIMRAPGVALLILLVMLSSSRLVAAQESRWYADGAFLFSTQGASTPPDDPDKAKPGVGGNAAGVVGSVGVFLSPRVSLAFEISVPERFDAVQELHYSFSELYDNRHRDLILSVLFHFHILAERSLRPEFIAGFSYVHEDTLQRTADQLGPAFPATGLYGPYRPETSITHDALGVTAGADLGIPVGAHLSIVPQARVYWIPRDTTDGSLSANLYLSPFVFRLAIGLRAMF